MTTIRPVRNSDRDDWWNLFTAYLHFYQTDLPDEAKAVAFERLLDDGSNVHGRIAEHEGEAVGFVHFIFHDHMWRPEGVVYLQDLFAVERMRGKGVGAALIRRVYDDADAAGVPNVYWLTQEFNHEARRLYDSIGKLTPFIRYNRA